MSLQVHQDEPQVMGLSHLQTPAEPRCRAAPQTAFTALSQMETTGSEAVPEPHTAQPCFCKTPLCNCVKTNSAYSRSPVLCQKKNPIAKGPSISLQFSHFHFQELFTFCREGRLCLKPCACRRAGNTGSTRMKKAQVTDTRLSPH